MEDRALFVAAFPPPVPEMSGDGEDEFRPPSRSMAFSVRLTAEERALVAEAAAQCQPPLAAGTWAKAALLEAARRFLEERRET